MASQVINGKAFEWAVGNELCESCGLTLINDSVAKRNYECFMDHSITSKQRDIYCRSAYHAVQHIIEKENIGAEGTVHFLDDKMGEEGDVRDIVITSYGREIGISCKTNHEAYKHSRLSDKVNFIQKWGLHSAGCSGEYFSTISPIFEELRQLKRESKGKLKWSDVDNVPYRYYWPILNAFQTEIERVHKINPEMSKQFIRYLVGSKDFYKIISKPKEVIISAYNLNGTLNLPIPPLPDKIDLIKDKNSSQYSKTIIFSKGWTFNFRIHSASSRVEPSLKFDVNAISLSPKLYNHHILFE